jgi:L-alanine-DL-glutamate epimerase-like enolase superfamily enzyme
MTFSPFDKRLMEEGLAYFARPRLASLLEMLGASEPERVDVLVSMLRNAPPDEFDEAIDLFERAGARAARQRVGDEDRDREDDPRRRRYSASAERRAQRRRSA